MEQHNTRPISSSTLALALVSLFLAPFRKARGLANRHVLDSDLVTEIERALRRQVAEHLLPAGRDFREWLRKGSPGATLPGVWAGSWNIWLTW